MSNNPKFVFAVMYFIFLLPAIMLSQELPLTLKTTYSQMNVGSSQNLNEKLPPEKYCQFWYFDEIKLGRLKFQNCEEIKIDQIKITSIDATQYGPTGWSKRYFGYDPDDITYTKDGGIIADWTFTIIFSAGKYSVFKILTTTNSQTGITGSVATMFYNL